jgi:hypothetical protein
VQYSADGDMTSQWDMSQLARRISSVQDSDQLERRLEALDSAWVLVFDADTDEEAVCAHARALTHCHCVSLRRARGALR